MQNKELRALVLARARALLTRSDEARLDLNVVARAAQLPLASVQQEFANPSRLGEALVDDYLNDLLETVLPIVARAVTDEELVYGYLRAYLTFLASRPETRHPALLRDADVRRAYRKMALGTVRLLMNAELERAMQRGALPRMPVGVLLSICFGVVMQAGRDVISGQLMPDEKTINAISAGLLAGLRAVPPVYAQVAGAA